MRYLMLAAFALAAIGCGTDSDKASKNSAEDTAQPDATPADFDVETLSIDGPGGTVAIGDDLETAQTAFPAPSGALVFDSVMNFAILGIAGSAWSDQSVSSGFEVGLENGKVIALIRTQLNVKVTDDDIAAQRDTHGIPTAEAVSENTVLLVWERGESVRFYLALRNEDSIYGTGAFTIIGPKEKLRLLSYHYDNPQLTVDRFDRSSNLDVD